MIRYVLFVLALPFLLVCGIGCTTAARDVNTKSTEASETRVYEVFGMNCPGCHGGLEKLVKKIQGIQHTEANWQKKQLVITIRAGSEFNDEDIYDSIRRANFTPGKRIE